MKKYLITGFSGFVGRRFVEHLENLKKSHVVKGLDIQHPDFRLDHYKNVKISFEKVDLLSADHAEYIINEFQPDYILHLASFSSVAFSWKEPILSFQNNMNIFLNLLESVRKMKLDVRILSIGSSEEYGNFDKEDLPLTEKHTLRPLSPYAVARVSQEMISRIYVEGYGLDILMTRSFNHIGPFQKDVFVIPAFARQIVDIKKNGKNRGELITGDTSIIRDFTDVRDVVAAYSLLLEKGKKGQIYNVCSGKGTSLDDIIDIMAKIVGVTVHKRVDAKLVRPNDNRIIVGSNKKIKEELGWYPKISLEDSLNDIIVYWQKNAL
ncbi:MAG: GDP-mannose 4,6-dehydratase [Syntrophaceae bacterium]|nr:GDP-mannose 4,6-dehydratase [Syntrophaceae bacterium]